MVFRDPSCCWNGDLDDANFSRRDLVLYLGISLGSSKSDAIENAWIAKHSTGHKKGGNIGVILPSSACQWRLRYGSFGTPLRVSR